MPTTRRLTAVLGLAAALALTGCGGDDDGATSADGADGGTGERADAPGDPAGDSGGDPSGAGSEAGAGRSTDTGGRAAAAPLDNRSIIYAGEITVEVTDIAEAARDATALAQQHGGFIGEDRRSSTEGEGHATLVLRIPSDDFTAAVTDLSELGEEESRRLETEDVTEEVVDLETRIATVRASVTRTRELLDQADSISDIVSVEEELTEREAELASLERRQQELADRLAFSTVTVHLRTPDASAHDPEPDNGFLAGLSAGWDAFTTSMKVLVTVLGALIPWLLSAAVPVAVLLWWHQRRSSRRPDDTPAPGTPASP